jgi:hypothetical protein
MQLVLCLELFGYLLPQSRASGKDARKEKLTLMKGTTKKK